MSNSIEQDAQKSKRKEKIAKIVAIVAAVLVVGWTIYSVAMNLNQSERYLFNSYVKYYREVENPATYSLQDSSQFFESSTAQGDAFQYAIIQVEKDSQQTYLLLVVDGKNNGKVYSEQEIAQLDCVDKQNIRFEITDHQPDINMKKVQQ